ncbi:hypothetical protein AAJ72_09020 [Citromicrobium sp. RCC1885]|uniref:helix-turn-helix domain-containing protein n=1 Tax=unclassified Citromicrobium TaxID=2630544 RepID=UPI0006C8E6D6|nr:MULTISPECIES: helix-turn-helix domain-containing protein [unclassified Citromicrobium]KPM23051.1 hypothetical protein AAJ72_09020 [Citromicrobium sp. RCC1885]KPM27193.1 hypothetical protein AAJ74_09760 [Citromicrobium sp. RCC1878]OAM09033.1 hypothetical protein A0U43_10540 [Citromicrobium sp. RCC1897]
MNAVAPVLIGPQVDQSDPPAETAEAIAFVDFALSYVMQETRVSRTEMESRRRTPHLVNARAMFVWLVKHLRPGISYPAIGRWIGDRDHKGLINLQTRAAHLRASDPEFKRASDAFVQACRCAMEVPYACD